MYFIEHIRGTILYEYRCKKKGFRLHPLDYRNLQNLVKLLNIET